MKPLKFIDRVLVGVALVVITTTLTTAGLTTAGEYQRLQRVSAAAADKHRSPTESQSGLSLLPAAPSDDPELMRLDRGNEHHG